jgi:hypothetical protein
MTMHILQNENIRMQSFVDREWRYGRHRFQIRSVEKQIT